MPSANVDGILGFVVFVGYYLRPVRSIVPQKGMFKILFSCFFLGREKRTADLSLFDELQIFFAD